MSADIKTWQERGDTQPWKGVHERMEAEIADLRAELARRDAVVSEEKFVRAAAETGVFCTMPQAVAFGHAVQPFRKVVAWRRATKHTWEYRTNAPTASTRGDGWMPLLDGDGPDAAVVSEGQAVAWRLAPPEGSNRELGCTSYDEAYAKDWIEQGWTLVQKLYDRPAAPALEAQQTEDKP